MPKVTMLDETARINLGKGLGVLEDGHPVDVPEDVAKALEKDSRLGRLVRVERAEPKPRLAPKHVSKED